MPRPNKRIKLGRSLNEKRWKGVESESTSTISNQLIDDDIVEDDIDLPDNTKARITKKIELTENIENHVASSNEYILPDFSQLSKLLSKVQCSECGGDSLNFELSESNFGFARKISLLCQDCELNGFELLKSEIDTSKRVVDNQSTKPAFDVNIRICTAFSFMGKGYSGIEQLSMIMNMSHFSDRSFDEYTLILSKAAMKANQKILDECREEVKQAYKKISNESTSQEKNNADNIGNFEGTEENSEIDDEDYSEIDEENSEVDDEQELANGPEETASENLEKIETVKDDKTNAGVSYDGSWPTKGFKSKHGFSAVIDIITGYVVDFDIASKYCTDCVVTAKALGKDSPEFGIWYEGHAKDCAINHEGSSGAMETTIAETIWRRSESYGFRYTTMLSDGDAKTFNHLSSLNIYGPEHEIIKEECINHVSKRVYTGLTNIVKEEKARKVTLGERAHGQLKEKTIKKFASYYKNAIHKNKGNIQDMKDGINASIHHAVSTDEEPQHSKCPEGKISWCFYQADLANNRTPGSHKTNVKTPLNKLCFEKILPLYERLTDESLLTRCARCLTQNANESLHSVIWSKCPKEVFVSKTRVQIAAAIGVSEYNLGAKRTVIELFKNLGLQLGEKTLTLAKVIDKRRLRQGLKNATEKSKEARRVMTAAQTARERFILEAEGPSYGPGMF